jgi:hypothetical protein
MSNIKRWYKLTNKTFKFGKKEQEQGILGTREQGGFGEQRNRGTRGTGELVGKGERGIFRGTFY